jgi:hypothetical protein
MRGGLACALTWVSLSFVDCTCGVSATSPDASNQSDSGTGVQCGPVNCAAGQACCTTCDGTQLCATDCSGLSCDSGITDSGTADSGSTDAGTNADSGSKTDSGTTTDSGSTPDSGPIDAGCNAPGCTGAGENCALTDGGSEILNCALVNGCLQVSGTPTICTSPEVCTTSAGTATCACPATGTALNSGCAPQNATQCDSATGNIDTCNSVGGCLVWQQTTSCSTSGLVCASSNASLVCQCPAYTGSSFYADAFNGSTTGALPFPTGAQSPLVCRFKKLGDALSAANAKGTGSQAIASGFVTNGAAMVFTRETLPLTVSDGVTLTTSDVPLTPADYVIDFDSSTASAAVVLTGGGVGSTTTFSGFTVQNAGGMAGADAVDLACTSGGSIKLDTDILNGASQRTTLTNGLNVSGTCAVTTNALDVEGFTNDGVLVAPSNNTTTIGMTGGTIGGAATAANGIGIQLSTGALSLTNVVVSDSTTVGINDTPNGGDAALTMTGGQVVGSGQEGILVALGTGATAASTVSITGTEITGNNTSAGALPGVWIQARNAVFDGVNVHANTGGGVLVEAVAAGPSPPTATVTSVSAVSHFDSNIAGASTFNGTGFRARLTGQVTLSGATFSNNAGSGAHAENSPVTFQGGTFNANAVDGLDVFGVGANAIVDEGSAITNNGAVGIDHFGGLLTVTGTAAVPVAITGNGAQGVLIDDTYNSNPAQAGFTGTFLSVSGNGSWGISVHNTDGANPPHGEPVSIMNSSFSKNAAAAVYSDLAEPTTGNVNSLVVSANTFGAGFRAVHIAPANAGAVTATIQNNKVRAQTDVGFWIAGTASCILTISGNDISGCGTSAAAGLHNAGGIWFSGTPPTTLSFTGNLIHGNLNDQVVVGGTNAATGAWNLSGSACGAATENQIYCYSTSGLGLYDGSAATATVTATDVAWQDATPSCGTDYGTSLGCTSLGAVIVMDSTGGPCGTGIATCP